MKTQTKEIQDNLTSEDAYNILLEGNKRFIENIKIDRDLKNQVVETSNGQFPFAVIHSCIDSRVPVELIFDQGIGDVFSTRVAGNIINEDVLGSIEYACKVAGSKLVVVLGHTKCGAVTAACQSVELGNITPLLKKIEPSVELVRSSTTEMNNDSIEKVSLFNVKHSIDEIRAKSFILNEMERKGEIEIQGAIYNVVTGKVDFI